jgi:hypothetical protein
MSRNLPAPMVAAAADHKVVVVLFAELGFDSGTQYLCNAGYSIPWGGHEWQGAGTVGSIEAVSEGVDLQARGVALTLSGVRPELIALAKTEPIQGRPLHLYLGLLDPTTYQVIGTPVEIWGGQLDRMTIVVDRSSPTAAPTGTITVTGESELVRWAQARTRRYTHEDQQIDYPGDKFFEFVPRLQDQQLPWP